ncbi:histidine phosphatase superfamily [Mycena crocata]|nr:histidine phosphatase superfamily [Mycena crocata]
MFQYEYIPGFFAQDDPLVDSEALGAVPPRFGLLDASDSRWSDLSAKLRELNVQDAAVSYKLFFFARHGEGYHNAGREKHGSTDWLAHWAMLNGDQEITWGPDAELTPLGKSEAAHAHKMWKAERALDDPMPLPEKMYCSPMTRAMQTHAITFEGVSDQRALVVENVREWHSKHTCDKRRTGTYIQTAFSHVDIESGFTEEDELWKPEARETQEHAAARARTVLDKIFTQDNDVTFLSVTVHVGIIASFLRAVNREWYSLPTGGVLPIVIKATKSV